MKNQKRGKKGNSTEPKPDVIVSYLCSLTEAELEALVASFRADEDEYK